jgi:hypothetical protein
MRSPAPSDASEIDRALIAWAVESGLEFDSFEHWDAQITRAIVKDSGGDIYVITAGWNYDASGKRSMNVDSCAAVFACLRWRAGAKYGANARERKEFRYQHVVSFAQLRPAFDGALETIRQWAARAGNTLPSDRSRPRQQ